MEEQLRSRPDSSAASRQRPGSSPASRNTTESHFEYSSRPATAHVHGGGIRPSRELHSSRESVALTTDESTFSLPVLSSEPASTVTLLQEDLQLWTELLPPLPAATRLDHQAGSPPPDYSELVLCTACTYLFYILQQFLKRKFRICSI